MRRPIHVWLLFAGCLAVLAGAMAWVTAHALRLEHTRFEATQEAERQERTRLAMWRLDFAASGLMIAENARDPKDFKAFHADESIFNKQYQVVQKGEVLRPSPLLTGAPEGVLLHFQIEPDGQISSPQAPEGNARDIAESAYGPPESFQLFDERLNRLRDLLARPAAIGAGIPRSKAPATTAAQNAQMFSNSALLNELNLAANSEADFPVIQKEDNRWAANRLAREDVQQQASQAESDIRNVASQRAAYIGPGKRKMEAPPPEQQAQQISPSAPSATQAPIAAPRETQPFHGFWVEGSLLLTRESSVDGSPVLQGAWLDWDKLRGEWLSLISDLFPTATLTPAPGSFDPKGPAGSLHFSTLPVKLEPGSFLATAIPKWNALTGSLLVAWACVLLAGGVAAFLLHRTLALSERRAAFVSSVTHELRTPLTTFRLYSEMLADGMVTDEATEKSYLGTLSSEAGRLSHLVENVLAYARLERGSARRQEERATVGGILQRMEPRLQVRATAAEMILELHLSDQTAAREFLVDAAALEQILFNLVDNACKYAGPTATDRRIKISAESAGSKLCIHVRDHGPGISRKETKRVFLPFHKSADQAAHSQPGVGLGLALCSRLVREMGGVIRLCATNSPGACFEVELPLSSARKN